MHQFVLIWLLAHGVPVVDAEAMAPCIAGYRDPVLLIALMAEENNYSNTKRSGAGACSYFQILGGRYDNPSCAALEADPALACATAVRELDYWHIHCGEAMLDAWNAGWARCWTNPKRKRCKAKDCRDFTSKVMEHYRWIDSLWRIWR